MDNFAKENMIQFALIYFAQGPKRAVDRRSDKTGIILRGKRHTDKRSEH